VFVFFSNKLGCLGSMLVSIVGTLMLLSMLHVIWVVQRAADTPTASPTGRRAPSTRSPISSTSWGPEPAPPALLSRRAVLIGIEI
jgi:hypothetical protein